MDFPCVEAEFFHFSLVIPTNMMISLIVWCSLLTNADVFGARYFGKYVWMGSRSSGLQNFIF